MYYRDQKSQRARICSSFSQTVDVLHRNCKKCGADFFIAHKCDDARFNVNTPSPQSPVSEEWEERFEKEIIDYFWDRETVIGTQRLSLNHINKIKDFIRKQRQEAYEEGLKERCQNMLSKEETYLKAQHELAEEIMDYMENGLDEPTDWYVSVKNFLSSRGLLPKMTENNI